MSGAKKLLKKAYDLLPFKQPVYTVVRSMAKVPEPIYRHLHFRGVIKVPVSKKESFRITHFGQMIENELFWKGITGWEPISMELWIRLCRRSNVIMDIGANTGVYALVAHAVNPQAKIAAVEPVERIHRRLQENINLNDGSILAVHAHHGQEAERRAIRAIEVVGADAEAAQGDFMLGLAGHGAGVASHAATQVDDHADLLHGLGVAQVLPGQGLRLVLVSHGHSLAMGQALKPHKAASATMRCSA